MISEHSAWHIKDSSKLSDFLDCRRQYMYKHILGWRPEVPSHDAYFGEAWHKAREHMLINGYDDTLGAFNAFMEHYRLEYDEETDDMFKPKNPEGALAGILRFPEVYPRDLRENKVLFTEVSGSVPVDERRVIYFRMDSVLQNIETGMIFSLDHKTTSEKNLVSRYWEDAFFLGIQGGTYTHCLYCMFPIEQVKGVEFCGAGFAHLKRGSKDRSAGYHVTFKRVPTWKTKDQMNTWLWNTIDLLDEIERETDRLMHCHEDDRVLMAFPLNPNSCTKYFGCPFHDYCMTWSNPLQHCFEPPLGFIREFWDPTEMETTHKMNLEWKE